MKINIVMRTSGLILFLFGYITYTLNAQVVDAGSIEGKWVCGYQGWFNAYGDGSPVNRWVHWSGGQKGNPNVKPEPGNVTFDIYPDISEYEPKDLFSSGFANLGDGRDAKLFSSYTPAVIDKHFEWMQTYGIDGIALQRFVVAALREDLKQNRDSIAARVRRSAEKYGRIFYMMYDISGLSQTRWDAITNDWETVFENELDITSSPQYAHQNGKPVICIWGFGFTTRNGTRQQCLDVINWFKDRGYYVIGGVPAHWRTATNDSKPDFKDVYDAFDMISPWSVGRYSDITGADEFKRNHLIPDKAYCDSAGIAYQPVIFPGFSWFNLKGGEKNRVPRVQGKFFWRQYYNIQLMGINNYYSAMFDEYDEGTNYMKGADSYYDIPTNNFFLTYSSDGKYVSSDFYLRLLGAANASRFSDLPLTPAHSVPLSLPPLLYRSSFEPGFDAVPSNLFIDFTLPPKNMASLISGDEIVFGPSMEQQRIGEHAIKISLEDQDMEESYVYYILAEVDIPVYNNLYMSFSILPLNELGRYVSIDVICKDGTRLKDFNTIDIKGNKINASFVRGTIDKWSEYTVNLGVHLAGKTIDRIMVGYDHADDVGDVIAYLDDMSLFTSDDIVSVKELQSNIDKISVYPNPTKTGSFHVDLQNLEGYVKVQVFDIEGKKHMNKLVYGGRTVEVFIPSLPSGQYFVDGYNKENNWTEQLVIE